MATSNNCSDIAAADRNFGCSSNPVGNTVCEGYKQTDFKGLNVGNI